MAEGKEVVIVGGGFVSMELAEILSPIVKSIHILSRSKHPYGLVFGEKTSMTLLGYFLEKLPNVTFHPTEEVEQFVGTEGVTAIHTYKKQIIQCQLVVLGMGSLPNTEFIEDTKIRLNPTDHSILVNKVCPHYIFKLETPFS